MIIILCLVLFEYLVNVLMLLVMPKYSVDSIIHALADVLGEIWQYISLSD